MGRGVEVYIGHPKLEIRVYWDVKGDKGRLN